jgi:hypothetical protein
MDRPRWLRSVATKVPGPYCFTFLSLGMDEKRSLQRKINTRGELVTRIMHSAALLKQEHQDDLWRATRTIVKRVGECVEVDGVIFEHLRSTAAIYWDHLHNQLMQSISHLSFLNIFKAFMRNIQTAVFPHPLKNEHMFIWTYVLGIVHTISQNIHYFSWNILYMHCKLIFWRMSA